MVKHNQPEQDDTAEKQFRRVATPRCTTDTIAQMGIANVASARLQWEQASQQIDRVEPLH